MENIEEALEHLFAKLMNGQCTYKMALIESEMIFSSFDIFKNKIESRSIVNKMAVVYLIFTKSMRKMRKTNFAKNCNLQSAILSQPELFYLSNFAVEILLNVARHMNKSPGETMLHHSSFSREIAPLYSSSAVNMQQKYSFLFKTFAVSKECLLKRILRSYYHNLISLWPSINIDDIVQASIDKCLQIHLVPSLGESPAHLYLEQHYIRYTLISLAVLLSKRLLKRSMLRIIFNAVVFLDTAIYPEKLPLLERIIVVYHQLDNKIKAIILGSSTKNYGFDDSLPVKIPQKSRGIQKRASTVSSGRNIASIDDFIDCLDIEKDNTYVLTNLIWNDTMVFLRAKSSGINEETADDLASLLCVMINKTRNFLLGRIEKNTSLLQTIEHKSLSGLKVRKILKAARIHASGFVKNRNSS
ncbi:hypothetical protein ENBRE01_0429 [Enteropsectra breve]|nr:hypothetical protein ENBRE01_0429 [Enteropsectra breve]